MESVCYSNSNSSGGFGSSGFMTTTGGSCNSRWEPCDQCSNQPPANNNFVMCSKCWGQGGKWVIEPLVIDGSGLGIAPAGPPQIVQPLILPSKENGLNRALERLKFKEENTCPHCKKRVK